MHFRNSSSVAHDLNQRKCVAGNQVHGQHVADSGCVELMFEGAWLQSRDLRRLKAVMEGSCGNRNGLIQVEHTSAVFRRVQQELLTIEIADLG